MKKSLALGRLLWRPATISALLPVGFAIISPVIILADRLDHGLRLGSPEAIIVILWIEIIILAPTLGGLLGSTARNVDQPLFAFAVPSLRAIVSRQKIEFGVCLAAVLAASLFFFGDRPGSIAAFGCALGFFALGSALSDPVPRRIWKSLGAVILIASWFETERLIKLFESAPVPWAVAGLLISAAIFHREQSMDIVRRRAFLQLAPPGFFVLGGIFQSAPTDDDVSECHNPTASPAGGRLVEFFKASDYEVFGARDYGWLKTLLVSLAVFCGFGYLTGNPTLVGLMGLMVVSARPHRLMGRWPYPISRVDRANFAFMSGLADCVSYFALGLITATLIERSGLPRPAFFKDVHSQARELALIPIGFIWSPIAIWTAVTGPPATRQQMKSKSWGFRRVVGFFIPVMFAVFTFIGLMRLERHFSMAIAVAVGAALAIAVQGSFWLALRWHFARKDLV